MPGGSGCRGHCGVHRRDYWHDPVRSKSIKSAAPLPEKARKVPVDQLPLVKVQRETIAAVEGGGYRLATGEEVKLDEFRLQRGVHLTQLHRDALPFTWLVSECEVKRGGDAPAEIFVVNGDSFEVAKAQDCGFRPAVMNIHGCDEHGHQREPPRRGPGPSQGT